MQYFMYRMAQSHLTLEAACYKFSASDFVPFCKRDCKTKETGVQVQSAATYNIERYLTLRSLFVTVCNTIFNIKSSEFCYLIFRKFLVIPFIKNNLSLFSSN
jgi:hypothetical protein